VHTWEDMISINARTEVPDKVLGPVRDYIGQNGGDIQWDYGRISLESAMEGDTAPLPATEQREGYYGLNHFNYWASGMRDACQIAEWLDARHIARGTFFDFGCATGRVLRHIGAAAGFDEIMGCDINRAHVDWIGQHLPPSIKVFQNTSIPSLPLADASVDVVTAFSVFTHIETFDTTWLMELRRILRPGGIAWLTIHGNRTWRDIMPTWPLYTPLTTHPDYAKYSAYRDLPEDRLVFRWAGERSYSANVFYKEAYIRQRWGRILAFKDIFPAIPLFQDIVVLQKD
jgi:SAM-dependent methyltransferase